MEKINKKTERSIELICTAMFKLLEEKDFIHISITELCQEAQVARKTFYRNFNSKEDVIKKSIDRMFATFAKQININKDTDLEELSCAYFEYWYKHREFLTIIFNNNLFNILNSQYDLYMRIFRLIMVGEEEMTRKLEYFIIFVSGGYWNILQNWVRKDFIDPPEELAKIWSKYINKIKCEL